MRVGCGRPSVMHAYEIRAALPADEDELFRVAHHLNTVNLPADRQAVRALLHASERAFRSEEHDVPGRTYVFVLVDLETDRLVGSSMIIAQLGRKNAPYIYVDVLDEERFSATLDRHIKHTKLQIGYSYEGPTELGGLIVDPAYRGRPEKLGVLISYVRFLFIKMHRNNFRDELLAELLPPLEPDGGSHLWNALGYHFTHMTYQEADRLSKTNKEFVFGLFPQGPVYATLLPKQAQEVIGKVGVQTKGVEKMLTRIGFHYAHRIDPFDGGPHFTCETDEATIVRSTHRASMSEPLMDEAGLARALVAVEASGPPHFRCVYTPFSESAQPAADVRITAQAMRHLDVRVGDSVWMLPVVA